MEEEKKEKEGQEQRDVVMMDANSAEEVVTGKAISTQAAAVEAPAAPTDMAVIEVDVLSNDHTIETRDERCKVISSSHIGSCNSNCAATTQGIESGEKTREGDMGTGEKNDEKKVEEESIARSAQRKLAFRILPLLCVGSMMYFTTRLQLSLAADGMMEDLSMSKSQFGFAISLYSIPYAISIIPLSVVAARVVGPRESLAFILFASGAASMGMVAVQDFSGLIAARMVLGILQAAFIPTVAYYNKLFFPDEVSKAMSLSLSLGYSIAQVLPLGAGILYTFQNVSGILKDWQYLFLIEGILALVLAPIFFILLPASPTSVCKEEQKEVMISSLKGKRQACGWICAWGGPPLLNHNERAWFRRRVASRELSNMKVQSHNSNNDDDNNNDNDKSTDHESGVERNLRRGKIQDWALVRLLSNFSVVLVIVASLLGFTAFTGVLYFAPAVISNEGVYTMGTSALLVTVPNLISIPLSIAFSTLADKRGKPIQFSALGQLVTLFGIGVSTLAIGFQKPDHNNPWLIALFLVALSVSISGWGVWYNTLNGWSSTIFPRDASAMGFSLISLGTSLGTFVGPTIVGVVAEQYNYTVAFAVLIGFSLATLIIIIFLAVSSGSRLLIHMKSESVSDNLSQEISQPPALAKNIVEL